MVIKPLKGEIAFRDAVKKGKRFSAGPATVTVSSTTKGQISQIVYVAVVIGKRISPKAVVRTRLRRLMRNAVRNVLRKPEIEIAKSQIDTIVVAWRSAPLVPSSIHLRDIEPSVEEALRKSITALSETFKKGRL